MKSYTNDKQDNRRKQKAGRKMEDIQGAKDRSKNRTQKKEKLQTEKNNKGKERQLKERQAERKSKPKTR